MTFYISVIDPPIRLRSGDHFDGHTVIMERATYGRIIFTESLAILCEEPGVTISNNHIIG